MQETVGLLSRLAPLLRVRPQLQQICRFGAQWASAHGPETEGWAPFHIVTHGACLLDTTERTAILLRKGDVAVLPHGGPHVVRALPNATGQSRGMHIHTRQHDDLVVKSNVDGEPDTKLICGRMRFSDVHGNMVLAALPAIVVLAAEGRDALSLRRIVELMQTELEDDRLGSADVAGALATTLMMVVLRAYVETSDKVPGILALLGQRQTAKALTAMLADPSRAWTLDELAAQGDTSRATLVRLFRKAAGSTPLALLSELRLTLARSRLRAANSPLAVIAEEVGYQSETAFSRAYSRRFAIAPGADRRGVSG